MLAENDAAGCAAGGRGRRIGSRLASDSGLRREVAVPISIDTYKAGVARAALDAGADIVNDVSALRFDPALVSLVAAAKGTGIS